MVQNESPKGATILAANHLSHVDPIAVIAAARRTTHYLAKDGHFTNPLTRFIMRATGQIETHREAGGSDALASAASILNHEKALGIFPEGTRSKRTEAPFFFQENGRSTARSGFSSRRGGAACLVGTGHHATTAPQVAKALSTLRCQCRLGWTWLQWLASSNGGNMNAAGLRALAQQDEHEIRAELARLYRSFTDQLMASMSALGAP